MWEPLRHFIGSCSKSKPEVGNAVKPEIWKIRISCGDRGLYGLHCPDCAMLQRQSDCLGTVDSLCSSFHRDNSTPMSSTDRRISAHSLHMQDDVARTVTCMCTIPGVCVQAASYRTLDLHPIRPLRQQIHNADQPALSASNIQNKPRLTANGMDNSQCCLLRVTRSGHTSYTSLPFSQVKSIACLYQSSMVSKHSSFYSSSISTSSSSSTPLSSPPSKFSCLNSSSSPFK